MKQARPAIKFVIPALPALQAQVIQAVQAAGMGGSVQIVAGQSHTVLAACDITLIASGTATLEAALFKRPMVISYKVNWLSYLIMKPKQLQPWIGLPNILCQDFVVPELLQNEATPQALAQAVLQWLGAPQKVAALQQRFTALHTELQRDTPRLATDAIEKILQS
jgi:lipid-A-disaccharide synthase